MVSKLRIIWKQTVDAARQPSTQLMGSQESAAGVAATEKASPQQQVQGKTQPEQVRRRRQGLESREAAFRLFEMHPEKAAAEAAGLHRLIGNLETMHD